MRKLWPATFVFGLGLAWIGAHASTAAAHATPHVLDIIFRPDGYLLLTNRGLIFGNQERTQWQLMCNEALGVNTSERPALAYLPDGRLLAGTSRGLKVTADRGCTWSGFEPFDDVSAPSLLVDPADPTRFYLAIFDSEQAGKSGLYLSVDGGAHWTLKLPAGPNEYLRSIRVAPSDPNRMYAAGQTWDDTGNFRYYLARSSDRGETWQRVPIVLEESERDLQLFEVSPVDSQLVVGRANGSDPATIPERLMVSRDGGDTFTSSLTLKLLSAIAFSADGSRAWVVGEDGIMESLDGLRTFARMGKAESMSFAVEREGELLACGYYEGFGSGPNGIGIAPSRGGEGPFRSFMQLSDVAEQVACEPTSTSVASCATGWLDWQREVISSPGAGARGALPLGGSAAPTAGSSGSSAAAAGVGGSALSPLAGAPSAPAASSRGCSVTRGMRASSVPVVAGLLLLLSLVARRRVF